MGRDEDDGESLVDGCGVDSEMLGAETGAFKDGSLVTSAEIGALEGKSVTGILEGKLFA